MALLTSPTIFRRRQLRRPLILFALLSLCFFFAGFLRDLLYSVMYRGYPQYILPHHIHFGLGPVQGKNDVGDTVTVTVTKMAASMFKAIGTGMLDVPIAGDKAQTSFGGKIEWHEGQEDPDAEEGEGVSALGEHVYREDGLLEVNPDGPHPIFELIKRAENQWKEKRARQSKSLHDAVREYKRRYSRPPPIGFDAWWDYVQKHKVPLPDEYSMIYEDLEPFWGVDPNELVEIERERESHVDSWTIGKLFESDAITKLSENYHGGASKETIQEYEIGLNLIKELLKDVSQHIPPFRAVFSPHDTPSLFVDWELKQEALNAAKTGTHISTRQKVEQNLHGWISACPPFSPAWSHKITYTSSTTSPSPKAPSLMLFPHSPDLSPKMFVHDHFKTMDPCLHPSLFRSQSVFLAHQNAGPIPSPHFIPQFSLSPTALHQDLRFAVPLNWHAEVPPGQNLDWDKKVDDRLYWRGANTGVFADDTLILQDGGEGHLERTKWRWGQRFRAVRLGSAYDPMMMEDEEEFDEEYRIQEYKKRGTRIDVDRLWVLIPSEREDAKVGSPVEVKRAWYAPALTDIQFVNRPISCEDATCDTMSRLFEFGRNQGGPDAGRYKYVLDIDGNGWSSRFQRLMQSNSVIFKATIYAEWFKDRIEPWYHYVPIQNDLSDMYDSLVFFRGDISGKGSHDDLGRKIALQAREWTKTHWRREDVTAFLFRQFLEYARVMSPNRDKMNFEMEFSSD